jgi:two-component system sensor histidine kinase ChiS
MTQARVLVADDDLAVCKMVGRFLEQAGYEVATANAGAQALAEILQEKPDLLILDVAMPRMTGWEVLSQLRAREEYQTLPILMLTALDTDADVTRGWALGADFYLPKPFRGQELVEVVKRLLQAGSAPPEEAQAE